MPGGHRPPHPARAGEVLARAGVVDAAVAGRREAALDAADRLGDVEVRAGQVVDGAGRRAPASSRGTLSLPAMRAGRVGVQRGDRVVDRAAGHDLVGDRAHLVLEALELLEAPGVGLVQVDLGAEEVARAEGVPLAADGVLVAAARARARRRGTGRTSAIGVAGRAGRCRSRSPRSAVDVGPRRPGRGRSCRRPPVGPAAHCSATASSCRLAATWPASAACGRAWRGSPRGRPGSPRAGRRCWPGLLALGRHQVEHRADLVQPAGDHGDLGLRRRRASSSSTSRPSRSSMASLATCSRSSAGRRRRWRRPAPGGSARRARRSRRGRGRSARRRGRHADVGGGDRVEGGAVVDVAVGDGVDGAGGGGVVGHAEHPSPASRVGRRVSADSGSGRGDGARPSCRTRKRPCRRAPDSPTCSGARIASITLSSIRAPRTRWPARAVQPVPRMTS